ncbi:hypothetical protein H6501_04205 [Candidatus Woesearchaeota archaeon]|nr:hypothetical protein [Candidatus Woesearchaeota archaeon]USN43876.1 MAG: hypothetical protein H6500_05805 [Candidatus Woesearchaeota archaeon]
MITTEDGEMFGDPVENEKGWEKKSLNKFNESEKKRIESHVRELAVPIKVYEEIKLIQRNIDNIKSAEEAILLLNQNRKEENSY